MSVDFFFDPSPFGAEGQWIKAGFHCHTVNSDGGLSPEATVARYREKDFRCLGITDHWRVTPTEPFSGPDFIGIDATENGGHPDIVAVGVRITAPRKQDLGERIRALAGQGAFTIMAHPTYSGVLPETIMECPELDAMEIVNAYCDEAYSNGLATELWDMVLGQGRRIWGVAGDDAHLNPRKTFFSDAGRAWVEIWAEDFSREAILAALKRGAFYSTQGPRFHAIHIERFTAHITCDPVAQVRWRTFGSVGYVDHASDGMALEASRLPENFIPSKFVRVELVDHDGRRAWSNPFFANVSEVGL